MNARKSARLLPQTVSRQLQSPLLKQAPANYPALINNPPPPSLTRVLPTRSSEDLPRTIAGPRTAYQVAKAKLDGGLPLSSSDNTALFSFGPSGSNQPRLTRRRPPVAGSTNAKSRALPIVFEEDEIRRQFFRDHPFEAYRPKDLNELDQVAKAEGPQAQAWTLLSQRSVYPSSEDCIAFAHNLVASHGLPRALAYQTAVSQFTTLRAEQAASTLSARQQAQAHGAVFYGEIERGVEVEDRVLDRWANAREIEANFAATRGRAGPSPSAQAAAVGAGGKDMWAAKEQDMSDLPGVEPVFTGGVAYVERFQNQGKPVEQPKDTLEAR